MSDEAMALGLLLSTLERIAVAVERIAEAEECVASMAYQDRIILAASDAPDTNAP